MKIRAINNICGVKKGNSEAGGTFIGTIMAVAILGIVAVAFLSGLATASKATFIADERATAESLARSQMEYVKSQDYINYAEPDHGDYGLITTPDGYSVELTAVPIDPDTGEPLASPDQDMGIQKITATIKHNDKSVLTTDDYKVDR